MKKRFTYRDVKYREMVFVPDQASAIAAIKPGTIAVVGSNEKHKSVKFLCPCGCGTLISVNLVPAVGKAWGARIDDDERLTLWPSVWLETGCQSHFIMRQSRARLLYGNMPRMTPGEYERWWSRDAAKT